MRTKRLKIALLVAAVLVLFALVFNVIGLLTPSEDFDELTGFGKIFAASPELSFESGCLVTSFGDFSFRISFAFEKPLVSLLADGPVIQINVIVFILLLGAMAFSCLVPEVSLVTSVVIAILAGTCTSRAVPFLQAAIEGGATTWENAAGVFWFMSFLLGFMMINGLVGIGGKIVSTVVVREWLKVVVTFLLAALVANAMSLVLCLFIYLTVGIGWCGGIMLWFIVSILIVAFCEVMDLVGL